MKQRIVDISVKHWNDRFVGISAIDISKKLNISHEEIILKLEELRAENKGTLNENVTLYQISLDIDNDTNDFKFPEPKPITTHIFSPSKQILENYYQENLIEFANNGEYTNKLHRGYNQTDLIFFGIKTLSRYLNNKEIYSLNDDVTGGVLRLNPQFTTNLHYKELDKIWFDKVWYGKRRLSNGEIAVSAILNNLSGLPKKEQSYWYSHELDNPIFTEYDEDFHRFVSRAYYGNWTESKDPIQDIESVINEINKIFNFKIFSESENPYLKYPINNTFKEFADCNSELYKIIGSDNLKLNKITKIYMDYCKGEKLDLTHKKTDRQLSTLQVMELILKKLNKDLLIEFKEHWEKVKQNRIEGDHKITKPTHKKENYIDSFRLICFETKEILKGIKIEFEKINGV